MNQPDEPTASTSEDTLRGLATEADAIHIDPPPAEESEAAGTPPADDAAPSPSDPADPAPAGDDTTADDNARELARLREDAARQKAEIARLTRLTSLQGGSGPGTPPAAPKRFADLSDRDMETEITRLAAEIDGF